ncbi:MAG: invasin domain 3-containing protein [Candidatus Eisenbacteria bacterium]
MNGLVGRLSALLGILLLAGLLLVPAGCENKGSLRPFEPTDLPNAFLYSISADPSMVGLGGRESTITVYVVDSDGKPVGNVEVAFAADLGTIARIAQTDSAGVARAAFQSGSEKGTATVVASIGSFEAQTTILIGANELVVGAASAVADGRTKVTVSAEVYCVDGTPAPKVPVTFTTSAGSIPALAVTDSTGRVQVTLTAPASRTDVQAEIRATVESEDIGAASEGGTEVVGVAIVAFRGITLTLGSDDGELVASGFDSTFVRCRVAETVSKVPVKNLEVSFGSDLGSIKASAHTNESGTATAVLVSGIYAGTASIVAFVETLSDSTTVEFTPLSLLPLKATPGAILIGGARSMISTRILNRSNNPVEGLEVRFETDLGVISSGAITDSTGQVVVPLTSGDSAGVATVHAWFGSLSVTKSVLFNTPVEEPLRLTPLAFQPGFLVADGASRAMVSTRLLNESNNPVPGRAVEFSTTLGVVTEEGITGEDGLAFAWLTSADTSDTAVALVTAEHGSLSVSGSITFLPPGTKIPNTLMLSPAAPSVQVAGLEGSESVILTAVAVDEAGDTIDAGWDVGFRILSGPGGGEYLVWPDSGSGSEVTVPISGGRARATLTAGTARGIVSVEARVGAGITARASVAISAGAPASAVIGIDSVTAAYAGGGLWVWTVDVAVRDAYANPVSMGTPVTVMVVSDTCGSGTVPAAMQIDGTVTVGNTPDCSPGVAQPGLAYACLTTTYNDFADFPSFAIEVRSSGVSPIGCLTIDHGGSDAEPASVVLVSVEDSSLAVAGVGGDETSVLTFEVRDEVGRPMRQGNPTPVAFQIVASPGGGVSLSRAADTTNAEGRVSTTVRSGTVSGVVKVRAAAGSAVSSVVNLAIRGGPPDAAHFSIAAEKVNIEGLLRFGIEDDITAFVYDVYGNPVQPGTAVYFTSQFGGILGSAVTDTTGRARSTLYSAAPLPTCAQGGLVPVAARTVDGANQMIQANMNVLFSGATVISASPSSFDVPNGGYVDLLVFVSDACGNPLVEGTFVEVTSSGGLLVGNTQVTLPDTQSLGYTQFWVRLTDSYSDETNPAVGATITVEVNSKNGDAGFVIFGTID